MNSMIKIEKQADVLFIFWILTDYCNFSCNYCPKQLHAGEYSSGVTPGAPTDDQIHKFIEDIISTHLRGRKLHLTLSGGEPTTHPMFAVIIEKLKPYGIIEVITNGSRSINWWKRLTSLPSNVIISLHPEFTDIDKINKLGTFLLSVGTELQINLICDPDRWDTILKFNEKLDITLRPYSIAKVLTHIEIGESADGFGEVYDYTDEQLLFMKEYKATLPVVTKQRVYQSALVTYITEDQSTITEKFSPFSLIANKTNMFNDWKCTAGYSGIKIRYDGEVFAGICGIQNLGKLDNFSLTSEDIICTRTYCPCPSDILLSKHK